MQTIYDFKMIYFQVEKQGYLYDVALLPSINSPLSLPSESLPSFLLLLPLSINKILAHVFIKVCLKYKLCKYNLLLQELWRGSEINNYKKPSFAYLFGIGDSCKKCLFRNLKVIFICILTSWNFWKIENIFSRSQIDK